MILLLTDETWERWRSALDATPEGSDLLAEAFGADTELPEDRVLVRMARDGEDAPAAITRARERRDAGIEAAAATRDAMSEMLLHVHGAGVPVAVLSRWFGLKQTRIYELLKVAV